MKLTSTLAGAFALGLLAAPVLAQDITIQDAYMRTSGPMAKTAAAFMHIQNAADSDDRLVGARSDIAAKVETHTHITSDDGVMKMRRVDGGFVIPAQGEHVLARGGDHLMFMGLNTSLKDGDSVHVVLVFENAGEIEIDIPVDLNRSPEMKMDMKMDHSSDG